MSKVFNMVGGGGKNISSIIITGLKSTDTVTCTKDGKSYTATWDETAQHWEIVGLPLGTFTIAATDGTKTITETVLIDIAGVYEIEMDFLLWLYNGTDEFEDVTGGFEFKSIETNFSPTFTSTKNNDNLYGVQSGSGVCGWGAVNPINIEPYTKINFELSSTLNYAGWWPETRIYLCNNPTTDDGKVITLYSLGTGSISRQSFSIPISSFTAGTEELNKNSCYLYFTINNTGNITLYNAWLE